MRKYKVLIIIVIIALLFTSVILIGYYTNNSVLVNLTDNLLMANKSPKQIREDQGSKLNRIIKIGITGNKQLMERDTLFFQGIEMAVEEVNSNGGVLGMKLETITADDQDTLTESLKIAQNFAKNTDVSFVIGHGTSDHTIPAAQIYDEAGVVLISPTATNPVLTQKGYDAIFRNTPSDIELGQKMADYAKEQGYKNIAIYYADSMIGIELSKAFEKYSIANGIHIIDRQSNFVNKDEFDTTFKKWKVENVDAVFFADLMQNSLYLVNWLRLQDNNLPILAGDGLDYTKFAEEIAKNINNFAFATFLKNMQNDQAYNDFATKFTNKFGVKPDYYAVKGYDTIKMISETVKAAKSTSPTELIKVLKSSKSFQGINGTVSFDVNGNLNSGEVYIEKVVNGKFAGYN